MNHLGAYVGLARKWRPKTFQDLAGQDHVSKTLTNAILQKRISQGYLFTGTRGTGKTSTARIFAKMLRCSNLTAEALPCLKCRDCTDIAEGKSIDVLEIDGASNNGVDAVRDLRENAKYLPSSGQYKIYIIDEVHMLSTAAFNALLKILEEPPAHLIFIFATTDPQKIPATVLSRCQCFEFRRASIKDLKVHFKKICGLESIEIDDAALAILARESDGSLRDGLSLLDQAIAICGNLISAEGLARSLGLVDKELLQQTLKSILHSDLPLALKQINALHENGQDLRQFMRELLVYVKNLILVQLFEERQTANAATLAGLDLDEDDIIFLKSLVRLKSSADLDLIFLLLAQGLEQMTSSPIALAILQLLIVKACQIEALFPIKQLSEHVEAIATPVLSNTAKPVAPKVPLQSLNAVTSAQKTHTNLTPQDPRFWVRLIEHVKKERPLLGTILENSTFLGISQNPESNSNFAIILGFSAEQTFYREQVSNPLHAEHLTKAVKDLTGLSCRLEYRQIQSSQSLQDVAAKKIKDLMDQRRRIVMESEPIRAAQEVLGARLERLEIQEGGQINV